MSWEKSIYTNAGVTMLSKALEGDTLTITRAVGGSGMVTEDELKAATAVTDEKQTLELVGLEKGNVDGAEWAIVTIKIDSAKAAETYDLHQIGIFGKLNSDTSDTLLVIMQDEHGVEIPAAADQTDFEVQVSALLSISNEANVTIELDSSIQLVKEFIRKELTGIGAAVTKEITIPAEGWTAGTGDYPYSVSVAVEDAERRLIPMVTLHRESLTAAQEAGICSVTESGAGTLTFWAKAEPEADISATAVLILPYIAVRANDDLPIASATQLGCVKIGDLIDVTTDGVISSHTATDDEEDELMKDIFG